MQGNAIFKLKTFFILSLFIITGFKALASNEPVILIHGFSPLSALNTSSFKYWGGKNPAHDIPNLMATEGVKAYAVSIGPFSSNWDRAIELYYQVKGGCVDYGIYHSQKFGHARFGRCYKGFYPEWDENHKVHFIGHSMGGQTARVLSYLLENGSPLEVGAHASFADVPDVYRGGHRWVKSVTTISAPNNGTVLAVTPVIRDLAYLLLQYTATAVGSDDNQSKIDLQLDQWGFSQREGESNWNYYRRVLGSSAMLNSKDFSLYDLGPQGAREINNRYQNLSDVYYFSIENTATRLTPFQRQKPVQGIHPMLWASAELLGHYIPSNVNLRFGTPFDWYSNDGVVNTISMHAPESDFTLESDMRLFNENSLAGPFAPGHWYDLGLVQNMDHLGIVGHCGDCHFQEIYRSLARSFRAAW